jgi:hypothetical protein
MRLLHHAPSKLELARAKVNTRRRRSGKSDDDDGDNKDDKSWKKEKTGGRTSLSLGDFLFIQINKSANIARRRLCRWQCDQMARRENGQLHSLIQLPKQKHIRVAMKRYVRTHIAKFVSAFPLNWNFAKNLKIKEKKFLRVSLELNRTLLNSLTVNPPKTKTNRPALSFPFTNRLFSSLPRERAGEIM